MVLIIFSKYLVYYRELSTETSVYTLHFLCETKFAWNKKNTNLNIKDQFEYTLLDHALLNNNRNAVYISYSKGYLYLIQ